MIQGNTVRLGESSATAIVTIRSKQKPGTAAIYCAPGEINPFDVAEIKTISKSSTEHAVANLDGLQLSDHWEDD